VIAGSKHEILQEQDRYRAQFWAAFDAFVPGTPLFKSGGGSGSSQTPRQFRNLAMPKVARLDGGPERGTRRPIYLAAHPACQPRFWAGV
jgi:hypothetical protein